MTLTSSLVYAEQEKLNFITVEYCPLSCKLNKGFALELTQELAAQSKSQITVKQASIQRAFQAITEKTKYHGMILGSKEHVPNSIFMKRPIYSQHIRFFSRKSLDWKYKGVDSLKGKRLAIIKGFHYKDQEVMNYIKNASDVNKLFHSDSVPKLIKMLDLNRIDIFIAGEGVARYHLNKEKLKNQFVISNKSLGRYDNYISFSKNHQSSEKYKLKFDQAFESFKKTKKFKDLLKKYFLID
jgi:polar amino acid transport system substrate-binding protein